MQSHVNVLIQNKPADSCSTSVLADLSNCLEVDRWCILIQRREILVRKCYWPGREKYLAISGPTKTRKVVLFEPIYISDRGKFLSLQQKLVCFEWKYDQPIHRVELSRERIYRSTETSWFFRERNQMFCECEWPTNY